MWPYPNEAVAAVDAMVAVIRTNEPVGRPNPVLPIGRLWVRTRSAEFTMALLEQWDGQPHRGEGQAQARARPNGVRSRPLTGSIDSGIFD